MELIIGGAFQGKLKYALKDSGYTKEQVAYGKDWDAALEGKKILSDVNSLIRSWMEQGRDPLKEIKQLLENHEEIILIMNEIGYGIVPMDKFEREYREETGRVGCFLAKQAQKVTRVVCGIGIVIKGVSL